jgi:hypothetical protein
MHRRDYDRACNWHRSLHVWGNVRCACPAISSPPFPTQPCIVTTRVAAVAATDAHPFRRRRQQRHPLHGAPGRRRRCRCRRCCRRHEPGRGLARPLDRHGRPPPGRWAGPGLLQLRHQATGSGGPGSPERQRAAGRRLCEAVRRRPCRDPGHDSAARYPGPDPDTDQRGGTDACHRRVHSCPGSGLYRCGVSVISEWRTVSVSGRCLTFQ